MRHESNQIPSARVLGVSLVAATVAIPVLLGTLFDVRSDALVPLALALPFATMGLLEAALQHRGQSSTDAGHAHRRRTA